MQGPQTALREIRQPAPGVDQTLAEVGSEDERQAVDRVVAAREIAVEGSGSYDRQRRRSSVALRSGLPKIEAHPSGCQELGSQKLRMRAHFRPELLNRLDDIVIFHSLTRAHIRQVVELQVEHVRALLAERRVGLVLSDAALDLLAEEGYDPHFGARPLKRTIQRKLQNPLAMQLLEGTYHPGDFAEVGVTHGALTFRAVKGDPVHA